MNSTISAAEAGTSRTSRARTNVSLSASAMSSGLTVANGHRLPLGRDRDDQVLAGETLGDQLQDLRRDPLPPPGRLRRPRGPAGQGRPRLIERPPGLEIAVSHRDLVKPSRQCLSVVQRIVNRSRITGPCHGRGQDREAHSCLAEPEVPVDRSGKIAP